MGKYQMETIGLLIKNKPVEKPQDVKKEETKKTSKPAKEKEEDLFSKK